MRQTPNGQSVTTFGIATNREWATKTGDRKNSAEFHECVAWARLAEICSQHLKKGQLVYVEGYLKTRSWDSLEGIRKFKTEIVVTDMIILEKRNRDDQSYNDYIPDEEQEMNSYEDDFVVKENLTELAETPAPQPMETPQYEAAPEPENTYTPEPPAANESAIDRDLGL